MNPDPSHMFVGLTGRIRQLDYTNGTLSDTNQWDVRVVPHAKRAAYHESQSHPPCEDLQCIYQIADQCSQRKRLVGSGQCNSRYS